MLILNGINVMPFHHADHLISYLFFLLLCFVVNLVTILKVENRIDEMK